MAGLWRSSARRQPVRHGEGKAAFVIDTDMAQHQPGGDPLDEARDCQEGGRTSDQARLRTMTLPAE